MKQRVIKTEQAPLPIGPYSQAVAAGGFIFCSGQIPLDPSNGSLAVGGVQIQAEQVLDNLEAVLKEAGSSLEKVVKLTVYLKDLSDFPVVNQAMERRWRPPYPARSTVQVAALPKGAALEIEALAVDA